MGMPGGMEWILIALVVLLLFGGKKIPELAKGLGSGIKNFKKAVKDDEDEVAENKKAEELDKKTEATTSEKNDTKTV
ncbi:Sec-independent protein translocase protein TatA [Malaciobacter pacificus]|jgi:sec-independent protein translocase protein TatA|uniref:Sec-independent protein translocase protein TatA n=1 Tax=Malaciobacter pacificus TaxID=1080223 RepID=A0A5C2H5B4_9BACT|nr:twin-arginine translocase TatA/TatE family subunit [Malaciobacter pacificus]QEP33408.1 twin arginine translocation system, TatA/E family protein [Malaciobacter pacificus]GGD31188.1 Sec-independent protein translocase protein TatA [Malaciobacter pacificus]